MYGASTVQIQFGYDPGTIQHRIKNTSFHKKTIFLEKKKFLSPFKLGNSIQYHVLVKESDYKRSFMNGVVSNYFTGSYKEMVSFFVRDRKISKKELEDLINIIEDEES